MSVFDAVAGHYDAARPAYPIEHFDNLQRLTRPLAGADVLDVGAGTGIAYRQLRALGARVSAVEPSAQMRERLLQRTPDAVVLAGAGEALPVADGDYDLVTYAQAFHWVDPGPACAEAARVLRPSGALAVWWNDRREPLPAWSAALWALFARSGQQPPWPLRGGSEQALAASGLFQRVESAEAQWTWRPSVASYLTYLASTSPAALLGNGWPAVARQAAAIMHAEFGDGAVEEAYRCRLHVGMIAFGRPGLIA